MKISILCPTRNRYELLVESIESIYNTASDVNNIEFLLGMDEDDPSLEKHREYVKKSDYDIKIVTSERFGYRMLHEYVNRLCEISTGKYLILWNDDARMQTENWDSILARKVEVQNKPFVWELSSSNHCDDIFPAIPREWYELLGHFSLNAHNDTWIQEISTWLNVKKYARDIIVFHLRGDHENFKKSDEPKHNTERSKFFEEIYDEVDSVLESSAQSFHAPEMFEARRRDALKLSNNLY